MIVSDRLTCRWCNATFGTFQGVKYHQTKGVASAECVKKQTEWKAQEKESRAKEIAARLKGEQIDEQQDENDVQTDEKKGEELEKNIDEKTTLIISPNFNSFLQRAFNYGETPIRIIVDNDEYWICAKDVCAVLDLTNSSEAISSLDTDERRILRITDTMGTKRKMACINESGLYRLIFKSRKEDAKLFQRWVTKEVIPQIRKTGSYQLPNVASPPLMLESSFNNDQSKIIHGMISLLRHQPIPCSPGTSLLYLGYLGVDEDVHHFKFGITENWVDRLKDLLRDFDGQFNPIFFRPGIGRAVEQELKRFFTAKGLLTKYKAKPYTEIFLHLYTDYDMYRKT